MLEGREQRLLALAETLAAEGRSAEAIDQLSELLAQNPEHLAARQLRGSLWRQQGELLKAESDLKLATQTHPQSIESWLALSQLLLLTGKPKDSLQAARQAVRLDGHQAQVWRTLGEASLAAGDADQAVESLSRCTQLSDAPEHWIALAKAFHSQGLQSNALQAIRYAQRLRPSNYDDLLEVGALLNRLGAPREAADHYRGLMCRYPYRWQHLQLLARIESQNEAWATCLALLNLAARIEPRDESLRNDLSQAYAACSRFDLTEPPSAPAAVDTCEAERNGASDDC